MGRMIKKAILPAAGFGTRLYSATKDQPKEMLALPVLSDNGEILAKPALQIIFEQLYNFGVQEFCFVIGSSKDTVLRHFTPDGEKLRNLDKRPSIKKDLESFYEKLNNSRISYVVQPNPKGFGDAVLQAENFIGTEDFWVTAGDTLIISQEPYRHFKRASEVHEKYRPVVTISLEKVENPRIYGVVEGEFVEDDVMKVTRAIEKPKEPPTNYAIAALYIFNPLIFFTLRDLGRHIKDGELQLTDGIDALTRMGVYGVLMRENERRFDIGSADLYFSAIGELYDLAKKGIRIV